MKKSKEELKRICLEFIDDNRRKIIDLGNLVYKNAELGYKEFKTTEIIYEAFRGLDLKIDKNIAYTGIRAYSGDRNKGKKIAVIGELDCIICQGHKDANPLGNVHACGHNVQLANIYGVAIGLCTSKIVDELDGAVDFIAIPAEECVDYQYRTSLIKEGKIKFFGGKQEYLSRGGFEDIDMALQCHMMEQDEGKICILNTLADGFTTKIVKFIGKASHAGFEPEKGINALNMANLAINNINALRETFRDEDKIRVSMIIKSAGELTNVVPSEAIAEIMIRGYTIEAMLSTSKKVNRAIKAAAYALGGKVEIDESIGYLPLRTDRNLSSYYKENAMKLKNVNEEAIVDTMVTAGSTDLGDISQLLPCMHVWTGGIKGGLHSIDYAIVDEEKAYIEPSKIMAMQIIDLLYDGAKEAKKVCDNFEKTLDKSEYESLMRENKKFELYDFTMI